MGTFNWNTMLSDEQARQEAMPGGLNVISYNDPESERGCLYKVVRWEDGRCTVVQDGYHTKIEAQRLVDALLALAS